MVKINESTTIRHYEKLLLLPVLHAVFQIFHRKNKPKIFATNQKSQTKQKKLPSNGPSRKTFFTPPRLCKIAASRYLSRHSRVAPCTKSGLKVCRVKFGVPELRRLRILFDYRPRIHSDGNVIADLLLAMCAM